MKKPDPRRNHAVALLCTSLVLSGCNSSLPRNYPDKTVATPLSEEAGIGGSGLQLADERGIGGSGKQSGETGIGGSGIRLADERGIGGSGKQPDETDIGGSGIQLADERGIGGSGKQPEETGIGGSGIRLADERGIGGSGRQQTPTTERWLTRLQHGESIGVVGTINDFGSIWVNGLHIHFDQSTRILMDGKAASQQQINLGQRAVIHAQMKQNTLHASSIELIHEVIGPVSQRNLQKRQLRVLSQTIQLTDNQPLPEVGSWVAVSGQRTVTQQISASRVDTVADQQSILLRGTLSRSGTQLSVSELALPEAPQPAADNTMTSGSFVTLRGQLVNNSLQAVELQQPQRLTQQPGVRLLSIERSNSALSTAGPYSPKMQGLVTPQAHPPMASKVIEAHIRPGQPPEVDQVFARPPTRLQHPMQQPATGAGPMAPLPLHPMGTGQPARPPQPVAPPSRPAASDRPAPVPRPDAAMRPQRPEALPRPERPARPDIVTRPERPVRPEIIARPERPQRPDKPQRPPR